MPDGGGKMANFPIPEAVLKNHTAVLGKTGSGKTHTEKLIVEHVVAEGARVCVLDTIKSDWWGLTSSADGKKPGLPFKILGGPRGHVPLHSNAGKAIGELVGTGKLPLSIIDMADFEAGGLQRFFVDFAQSLWRHARGVVYLVIEEAHEIAPKERAGFGAENLSIHWAKKLATGSRTKGIRLIVATQRVQALHNAVLGSCETVIAHRLTFDADQRPVIDWLKNSNKAMVGEVAESLASLPNGTGWLCSGEAEVFKKVAFPLIKSFDNGATPTDDGAAIEVTTAPVDQDELRSIIGDAVKEAEANDPKALRKRVTELERELQAKKLTTAVAAVAGPMIAPPAVIQGATQEQVDALLAQAEEAALALGRHEGKVEYAKEILVKVKELEALGVKDLAVAITRLAAAIEKMAEAPPPRGRPFKRVIAPAAHAQPIPAASSPRPHLAPPRPAIVEGDDTLTGPQQKLLDALAWWKARRHDKPTRAQIGAIAGWKAKGSNLKDRLSELMRKGIVTYPTTGLVALTELGASIATEQDLGRPLIDCVREMLTGPQCKVFNALLDAGCEMTRVDIGAAVGWEPGGSNLKDRLSELSAMEIVNYPQRGSVAFAEWVA